jgi:hypothetical protein
MLLQAFDGVIRNGGGGVVPTAALDDGQLLAIFEMIVGAEVTPRIVQ